MLAPEWWGCGLPFPPDRQWPSVLRAAECGRSLAQLLHGVVGYRQARRPEVLDHTFLSSARAREPTTISQTVRRLREDRQPRPRVAGRDARKGTGSQSDRLSATDVL